MRVLVEQSEREAKKWIENLKLDVKVHALMGGVDTELWYLHPEKPAVLIGTQDMLLSRVLNRGYAASRFHWPIDFGLLNNDCLWVFDEPQLMGSGVSTSAQLAGLRKALGTFGSCPSVWMSATLEQEWLDTVDFRGKLRGKALELGKDQYRDDYDPERPLYKRMTAEKTLARLEAGATKDGKEAAAAVVNTHQKGSQTLIVLNTVDRVKAVYAAIKKDKSAPKDVLLVHSRFRSVERQQLNERLHEPTTDRIIVATQVVEAGVDISARTLVTELAPWASIVQRIGRCNRTGDDGPGRVFWIDLDTDKQGAPYQAEELTFSRKQLEKLEGKGVSPRALDDFKRQEKFTLPFQHTHVVRRRDLLDLFDTTPDLSGNDIEISRFVRGEDVETDVQVFWRDAAVAGWDTTPHRGELCNVPVGVIKAFLEKSKSEGLIWDHLEEAWRPIRDPEREVRPGSAVLLPHAAGGYSELGWDGDSTAAVQPVPEPEAIPEEGAGDDPNSSGPLLTISQHTNNVCGELGRILDTVAGLVTQWVEHLKTAALWHDAGKAHEVFQASLRKANPDLKEGQWAKSGVAAPLKHGRKYFRHELVSALVALQHELPFAVAYLVAGHHGKIRLSIRSLPGEDAPDNPATLFALGVHDGDTIPEVDLGGVTCPATTLDLLPMRLGGESSWTARALILRDEVGPFRVAYLEALLRAADLRASANERKETGHG